MKGRKAIKDTSILIGGVTRNCAGTLRDTLDTLENATAGFRSRAVYIVESDSDDQTVHELEQLSKEGRLRYESHGRLADTMPQRTERIAYCRNRLLEFVKASGTEFDFVMLADMDGLNTSVTRAGVEDGWFRAVDWDVITANQLEGHYDVWALRHRHWMPEDCWRSVGELERYFGVTGSREIAVHSRQATLQLSAPLLSVDSAFGGLAIYRREAFVSGHYTGMEHGWPICEHVPFHRMLRDNGYYIFINPQLINSSPVDHLASVHWRVRLVNRLLYLARRFRALAFPNLRLVKPKPVCLKCDAEEKALRAAAFESDAPPE